MSRFKQHRIPQLYGLSITFAILFMVSWIGHIIAEWNSFTQLNSALGLSTSLPDFFLNVMSHTLENWQSDFLQAFTMVTLGAWLIHKNRTAATSRRPSRPARSAGSRAWTVRSAAPPAVPRGAGCASSRRAG